MSVTLDPMRSTPRYPLPQVRADLARKMVFVAGPRQVGDTDGREVDFVIVEGRTPRMMVECKWSDAEVDRSLRYLKAKFPAADAWQVSATGTKDYVTPEGIRVAPALTLLRTLV